MYGTILKSLNIVNLYRGISKLKLKISVKVPQLLCIVVSVALNGEFERFSGFCVDCYYGIVTVNATITRYYTVTMLGCSNSQRKTHQIAQIRQCLELARVSQVSIEIKLNKSILLRKCKKIH